MSSSFLSLISSKVKIVPAILSTVLSHLFTLEARTNFFFLINRRKPVTILLAKWSPKARNGHTESKTQAHGKLRV